MVKFLLVGITILCPVILRAQTNVLFVGNSFTHGNYAPVVTYNSAAITDADGTGYGGIPGIFKKFTTQAGLSYNVTIEAVSGMPLSYHLANKSAIIGQPQWNVVVLQELSTGPLPTAHGGDPSSFQVSADALQDLILSNNAAARVMLYDTWASPTSVSTQSYTSLQAMQNDLTSAYYNVKYRSVRQAGKPDYTAMGRVGDGFLQAVNTGYADPNPGNDNSAAYAFDLWGADNRHPSIYGAYLSAAVWFGKITGGDPRTIANGAGTAASDLGLSTANAQIIQEIAYEINMAAEPAAVPPPAAVVNTLNAGTNLNWNAAATWSGGALIANDSVLINANSATVSQVANSLNGTSPYPAAILNVSFDIGSATKNVQPNLTTQNPRTMTLSGGTDALGGTDLIHLSAATTGAVNIGTNTGFSTLTVAQTIDGSFDVENAAATLTLGTATILSGSVNLTKSGAGRLVLSGVNTAGAASGNILTVSGGALLADTAVSGTNSATGVFGVLVVGGGTLGGTGQITPGTNNGGVKVQSGGIVAPGDGGIGTLTLNGVNTTASVLTLGAGAVLNFELNSTGSTNFQADRIALLNGAAGDLVFSGNTINFSDLTSGALPAGSYTLITAAAANNFSGLTLDANGYVTGGLSVGSGLGAYSAALQLTGSNLLLQITPTPYTAWKAKYFSLAERQNAAISGDLAMPAGDGVTNLLKYAFNIDPHASASAVLPTASLLSANGVPSLELTFRDTPADTDINYVVEVSPDLLTWNSGTNYTAVVSTVNNPDGVTQTVQVRALDPQQHFARLRVTRN